jgi:hypothetical protein
MDIHLGYSGGSGGFIFFHFLLLSRKYHASWHKDITIDEIIRQQWNITDSNKWKSSEIPPSNYKTLQHQSEMDRIFFFCHSPGFEYWRPLPEICLMESYNNIKDAQWPNIESFEAYQCLPEKIREECENFHGLSDIVKQNFIPRRYVWLYTDINSQNKLAFFKKASWYYQSPEQPQKNLLDVSSKWKNTLVLNNIIPFLEKSDIQVKLQDFVNDPKVLIDLGLISEINDAQIQLINKWKNLHTKELLDSIGIF